MRLIPGCSTSQLVHCESLREEEARPIHWTSQGQQTQDGPINTVDDRSDQRAADGEHAAHARLSQL